MLLASLAAIAWMPAPGPAAPDLSAYPWFYLREGEPLAAGEAVVELVAVGDVMLGRGVAGVSHPFATVAPWLRTADVAMGNLECVVARGGTARPGPYRLRAPLSAAGVLRAAGFDLLGLANNHALDFGADGLAETVARLHAAGIAAVGAGPGTAAAGRPLIREIDGVRLAFLAFNLVPDPEDRPGEAGWTRAGWDRAQATAAITAARARADAVIVSVHWGYEYDLRADPAQHAAVQAMVDAGASLVIGHHPHVVQAAEVRGESFVAYSLGNFVFDRQEADTRQGLALRGFFDQEGLRAVQALPVGAGPRPRLMAPEEAASLLARVQPPPRRIGFSCDGGDCRPAGVPQTAASGIFRAGAIDLTGDGVPEQVQLLRGGVTIYSDGAAVWRTPPQWRVVDAALGDPNDDGRGELFLAFWRPDGPDLEGSHPFIVGYRRGAYRVLWGGSAVDDPILEVALGDMDGDGVQELVVLAERRDAAAAQVAGVWHWYGWGFSQVWRSLPGRYRDLMLIPGRVGRPALISVATEP
jgi:poly-gamma-glutamate synthesis protein (capsule biosynthesis protein)